MKKLFIMIFSIIISIMFTSCSSSDEMANKDLGLFHEKEIVLGNEVTSIKIMDNDQEVTIDKTVDFYDVYSILESNTSNKMISINSTIQIDDDKKIYSNENFYSKSYSKQDNNYFEYENLGFREIRGKVEGSLSKINIEEYTYSYEKIDNKILINKKVEQFARYKYKLKKAFIGLEVNEGKSISYVHHRIPCAPECGTKFADVQSKTTFFGQILNQSRVFSKYDVNYRDEIYEYDKYAKRNIKLYNNYIVLEQEDPFFTKALYDGEIWRYNLALDNKCSTKVTVYYNLETDQFEHMTIKGDFIDNARRKVKVNISCFVFDLDEFPCNKKIEKLKSYIKRRCN